MISQIKAKDKTMHERICLHLKLNNLFAEIGKHDIYGHTKYPKVIGGQVSVNKVEYESQLNLSQVY